MLRKIIKKAFLDQDREFDPCKLFFWLFGLFVTFMLFWIPANKVGKVDAQYTGVVIMVGTCNCIWESNNVFLKTSKEESKGEEFCINEELIPFFKEALNNGKRVVVYFKNDTILWRWECNGGGSIIYDAKYAEE